MGHRRLLADAGLLVAHDLHAAVAGPLLFLLLALEGLLGLHRLLLGEDLVDPDVPGNPFQVYLDSRQVGDDGQEELNQK